MTSKTWESGTVENHKRRPRRQGAFRRKSGSTFQSSYPGSVSGNWQAQLSNEITTLKTDKRIRARRIFLRPTTSLQRAQSYSPWSGADRWSYWWDYKTVLKALVSCLVGFEPLIQRNDGRHSTDGNKCVSLPPSRLLKLKFYGFDVHFRKSNSEFRCSDESTIRAPGPRRTIELVVYIA